MSDAGNVVRATVVARLLGIRLLRLDARVEVEPARAPRLRPRRTGSLAEAAREVNESARGLAALRSNGAGG